MVICEKCGEKTVLAIGSVDVFEPDSEPYEAGKTEAAETDEIDALVIVGINYCENCGKIVASWIEN